MTYEIYRYIFIGAAILCGIMAIVSIALFFLLKIPRVIGDLTGSTARKAIEKIKKRQKSEIQSMIENEVKCELIRNKSEMKERRLKEKEEQLKNELHLKAIKEDEECVKIAQERPYKA